MRHHRLPQLLCLGLLFLLAACATTHSRYSKPSDYIIPMESLSRAVDAELHNPFSTNRLADGELLAAAMNGKPELQEAFRKVTLLATNQGEYAIIMLVKKGVVWLEDGTWTQPVDRFLFLSNPPPPVRFTLEFPK